MTGTEVLRRVRNIMGDNGSILVEDADGIDAINDALVEVARALEYPIAVQTTSTVAGTFNYALPSDYIKPKTIHLDGRRLSYRSRERIEEFDALAFDPDSRGEPQFYFEEGENLTIWPTPSTAITNGLVLRYVKLPTFLAAVGNEVTYRAHIHPYIVQLVLAYYKRKDEDFEAANFVMGDAISKLMDLKSEAANPNADSYNAIREYIG